MEITDLLKENVFMANKPAGAEKRVVNLGVMVGEDTKQFLAELAREDSRSISWVAYELLQRGIAQFRRDGLVREPEGERLHDGKRRRGAA